MRDWRWKAAVTGLALGVATQAWGAQTATDPGWNCRGNQVPPPGYEQETASLDKGPGAAERADLRAKQRLIDRLCGDRPECASLGASIVLWKRGEGDDQVCTMAVLDSGELLKWRKSLEDDLDRKLKDVTAHFVADVEATAKAKGRPVRVVLKGVVYNGVPGGLRADWFYGRMKRALKEAGAIIRPAPDGWAGAPIPKETDLVIEESLISREDAATRLPILELSWSGKDSFQEFSGESLQFAAANAPADEPGLPPLPTSRVISLRMDTRPDGSLCRGQHTQVNLHSEKALHVRVFDLYGTAEALLEYPTADHPDDTIAAGATIPLGGPDGFTATPVGDEPERFLVIAAPTEEGLGVFRPMQGFCKVETQLAAGLHTYRRQGLSNDAEVTNTGYRILNDPTQCPKRSAEVDELLASLAKLPICP